MFLGPLWGIAYTPPLARLGKHPINTKGAGGGGGAIRNMWNMIEMPLRGLCAVCTIPTNLTAHTHAQCKSSQHEHPEGNTHTHTHTHTPAPVTAGSSCPAPVGQGWGPLLRGGLPAAHQGGGGASPGGAIALACY